VKVIVLGGGRVGSAIAADLAAGGEFDVTVADRSRAALERVQSVAVARTVEADLSAPERVRQLAGEHDLAVSAVPAQMGYRVVEAAIEASRHVVDISFLEEDPFQLDEQARRRGVIAVMDAGVSPGLSNLILGYLEATAERVDRYVCYVGGLPEDRSGLFQYKAPFSPADVIEVYTRPARYKAGGVVRTAPALSDTTNVEVPGVGRLEAFLTDGLRTLLADDGVPDMREMTLRYPGHAGQMALLRDMGLFATDPLELEGATIRPRDVTTRLLFPFWEFQPGEADITVLRVEVDAVRGGTAERHVFDLFDRYDAATDTSSMGRTTGYTCTAIVRLLARGQYTHLGVSPPERVGQAPGCFERIVEDLAARGVALQHTVEPIEEGQ
jgi:saccharopine dehydrogenase-like NADP-dependent oxidoreductase